MRVRIGIALTGLALVLATPAAAQRPDCAGDAGRIERAEAELPKLEVAPPGDRQIVCITLETNLLFAQRLAAHVKQCPRSPYVREVQRWSRQSAGYAKQFRERGCKATIGGTR